VVGDDDLPAEHHRELPAANALPERFLRRREQVALFASALLEQCAAAGPAKDVAFSA